VTASSELRPLSLADVAGGFALSSEAGWNQSEADWRFLLRAGAGIGIDDGGRLVATATVLPLGGRIGWIGMVLVALSHRKRGFATRMMEWALGHCRERGLIAALDATPAGREVYRRLGFEDGPRIRRLVAPAGYGRRHGAIVPLAVDEILGRDRAAFGADRARVLHELASRAPALALALAGDAGLRGYVLGRIGRIAAEIGPLVAEDDAAALSLLDAACAAAPGPALADVFAARSGVVETLLAAGWTEQRWYTRMSLSPLPAGTPANVFAIAGPEYG
jgi:GNAT superfamily N-acetyltransferase